jgi:hypothetical protein
MQGVVLDSEGRPAPGVCVSTSAGGRGTTDARGAYNLEVEVPIEALALDVFAETVSGPAQGARHRLRLAARARQVRCGPLRLASTAGTPRWLSIFGERPGVTGNNTRFVSASAVYDDGSGPALYVGGEFLVAGGADARYVARWNGQRWEGLQSELNGRPTDMAVHDDGSGPELFVCGFFSEAGGQVAESSAKWNGHRWAPLESGSPFQPNALAVHDDGHGPALYASGIWVEGAGLSWRVMRWDGALWSPVGEDLSASASALASFDDGSGPKLYVGGNFTSIGGQPTLHIARWNGASWDALSAEPNDAVLALHLHDDGRGPALFVGGRFTSVGGLASGRVARWDGTSWSAVGAGTNGNVLCLQSLDEGGVSTLYAGGGFTQADGNPATRVARWDGSAWHPLEDGLSEVDGTLPLTVETLAAFDENGAPTLFAGGSFARAGELDVAFLARWRGGAWTPVGNGLGNTVRDAVIFDDGSGPALHVGGEFLNAAGERLPHVAKWNGGGWEGLGGGIPIDGTDSVFALAVHDDGGGPALFAGGRFERAGNISAANVARWDGTSWSSLGSGTNGTVLDLVEYDDGSGPALYACGDFTRAGGVSARGVARWDGSWSGFTGGGNFRVNCLGVYDDGGGPELYVGGPFTRAGGVPALNIAKWDGSTWAPVGAGIQGVVGCFAVHDDGNGPELYVGGNFTGPAGGQNIARWNGTRWAAVGGGTNSSVWALASHDDGHGAALYAGGLFTTAGGLAASRLARWDGSSWSALGSGIGAGTSLGLFTLLSHDDGHGPVLYAGGEFWRAGNAGDGNLAGWGTASRSAFVLDFETEDDFTTALANGQHLDTEFGTLVGLTSSGPNAGLAAFDSTVGGPNDPSQDRDLLVGSGKLLILQTENYPPDSNGIFPRPNDDEDGGTITLNFARPVEALGIALADVDASDGTWIVALRDGSGRSREYRVPPGWTGDRLAAGPGRGVLDLTTLVPQAGFAATATASEDLLFDPLAVVRLSVLIPGSGAIDDVTLAGVNLPLPRATTWTRNGSNVNPRTLRGLTPPVLGTTWTSELDCTEQGPGLAVLEVRRATAEGPLAPLGQVLVGGELVRRIVRPQAGAPCSLTWDLPLDMSLVGLELHAQGLCTGGRTSAGRTGLRTAQRSNALGLRLGF